jgi:hypothetical protein
MSISVALIASVAMPFSRMGIVEDIPQAALFI